MPAALVLFMPFCWPIKKLEVLPPPPKLPPPPPLPPAPPLALPPLPPPPLLVTPNRSCAEKFCWLILLKFPTNEILRLSFSKVELPPAVYFPSVPRPAYTLPNCPLRILALVTMLRPLVVFPSSTPVNCAWSLNRSKIWILSTISAGRFLKAAVASSPNNSRPSIVTRCTFSPCAFTTPFSMVMPGIFLARSSTVASGFTLN